MTIVLVDDKSSALQSLRKFMGWGGKLAVKQRVGIDCHHFLDTIGYHSNSMTSEKHP